MRGWLLSHRTSRRKHRRRGEHQCSIRVEHRGKLLFRRGNRRAELLGVPTAAIELSDGTIITSKTTDLLGASAALLLNALKYLGGVDHDTHLISPEAIGPIQELKTKYLGGKNPRLHTDEVLIALSMSAMTDENAQKALEQLPKLRGCQVHTSVMLSDVDSKTLKRLGVDLTCEPVRESAAKGEF